MKLSGVCMTAAQSLEEKSQEYILCSLAVREQHYDRSLSCLYSFKSRVKVDVYAYACRTVVRDNSS
jgi:hypothetical protein